MVKMSVTYQTERWQVEPSPILMTPIHYLLLPPFRIFNQGSTLCDSSSKCLSVSETQSIKHFSVPVFDPLFLPLTYLVPHCQGALQYHTEHFDVIPPLLLQLSKPEDLLVVNVHFCFSWSSASK